VFNFPDDPSNALLDFVMSVVFILFIVEIVLNVLVDRAYLFSFFFFMDMLGSASMIFEISFILGPAGEINHNETAVDPVIMRTARVAKTAARAGRFLKLTKCVQFIGRRGADGNDKRRADTAKTLSHKLMLTLSTKVSLLTIILVIIVPVFQIGQYPEEDLSMKAWGQRLEDSYMRAYHDLQEDPLKEQSDIFAESVNDMRAFYSSVNYFPYLLEGYGESVMVDGRLARIPGAGLLHGEPVPVRLQNVMKLEVSECTVQRDNCQGETKAAIFFNFASSKRLEAGLEMSMSCFVIFVMGVLTSDLNQTIDRLVVKPLERMLSMVREVTSTILNLVQAGDSTESTQLEDIEDITPDETELLERVFDKLSKISSIALQENVVNAKDMEHMSDEAKGVIVDMMNMGGDKRGGGGAIDSSAAEVSGGPAVAAVASLPCPEQVVNSWNFDVLQFSDSALEQVALHIFFDSRVGQQTGSKFTEVNIFTAFFEVVMAAYQDQPYHNRMHAVDILHTCYRLLCLTAGERWASDVEQYGLLIAAMCHDMGHMGKTNPFLVETGHDLALRYNDASPLENMHCSSLFKVCTSANTNVFKSLNTDQFKIARRTCVATILHTDNAHHFEMVKDINKAYEINSETCDKQAQTLAVSGTSWLTQYLDDVIKKDTILYLELFLHFSDVSNPLKPFPVCQAWAWRVLDEFFAQGDEEKRLGIPVGMLNDRDKINKPGSQHGFINFLVAPLVFGAVKIFPTLHPLATQMASNLRDWRDIWVEEVKPDSEAVEKKDVDVQKVADAAEELRKRSEEPPEPPAPPADLKKRMSRRG